MARIVAVAPDLLLGSRISEALSAAGHEVTLSASASEAPLGEAELLICDLERESVEALVGLGVPVLGFYPHMKAELRQVAEATGADLVVPRSRMVRELPQLVSRLLAEHRASS